MTRISLIIPMLNERENVPALVARLDDVQRAHDRFEFEFVVVDDGSSDGTGGALLAAAPPEMDLRLLTLSRNFGSHAAVSAGLDHCTGDAAIVIGADLQEPPDLVARFIERWEEGVEVVWGIRERRAVARGLGAALSVGFSRLFHRYSEIKSYPAEGPSGVMVDRAVIDAFKQLPERHRNAYGLIAWLGFRQDVVRYEQLARNAGRSKWTLSKLVKLAIDSFVEFSSAPVRFASYCGLVIATLGFLYAIVLVIDALVLGGAPQGWTSVMVVVLIVGGLQLAILGVLGEYIWRGTDEARRRPLYVLRPDDVIRSAGDDELYVVRSETRPGAAAPDD
jgi:dolichol-phosphate mannosyltransferase